MLFFNSPAKINLFLRIVKQELNGYHYLQTLFQFISIMDRIGFELRNDDSICTNYHNDFITEENDLIVKAIKLLQKESQITQGLNIRLTKDIPMGAGLGGGSSNAATALIAVNKLYNLNYNRKKLQELGRLLGADVPIFIYGHSAWAEGIGDKFTPMKPKIKDYLLLIPPISISTQKIFQFPTLSRLNTALTPTDNPAYLNDCTSAIFACYPIMEKYIKFLEDLKVFPKITGTGSCIYIDPPTIEQSKKLEYFCQLENIVIKPFHTQNIRS